MQWSDPGCTACGKTSPLCLNGHHCATRLPSLCMLTSVSIFSSMLQESECIVNGEDTCRLSMYLAWSGTDARSVPLTTGQEVARLRKLSASAFYADQKERIIQYTNSAYNTVVDGVGDAIDSVDGAVG
eukprot:scaffold442_cov397-Prasinococcus_capsulatus_cf.AAC.16